MSLFEIDPRTMPIRTVRLTPIDLCCARILERGVLTAEGPEVAHGIFRVQLRTYLLGLPAERVEIHRRWPMDWWQALKENWAPRWFLRRWPVQYERIDISRQLYAAVCPHLEARTPDRCLEFFTSRPISVDRQPNPEERP